MQDFFTSAVLCAGLFSKWAHMESEGIIGMRAVVEPFAAAEE